MKPQAADDREAVRQTLEGDRQAFRFIVERYTPLLYSLAARLLGPGPEVEDAVQEIFERLYRNLRRYDPARSFHPWMYTIALNHLRSARRRSRRGGPRGATPVDPLLLDARAAPEGAREDPAQRAADAEGERLAARALEGLPARYREVFVLRQMEGLSVAEVAAVLSMPEGTVKTLLHRARQRLAERLTREGWT